MRKKIIFAVFLCVVCNLQAEISVKSFRKLENDMTARIDAPKKDQNGDVCAIIKVVTTQSGFIWEPDGLGIVSAENKGGEYWLYVPFGAKRLTIKHSQLGVLRDFMYNIPIEKATVYELVLTSGKVITTVEETIESQWLIIKSSQPNSNFYIDDQWKITANEYQAKLKPGKYNYRVETPLYHSEAGVVEITDTKKILNVDLKPAFGYLSITSDPEPGASILIDGKPSSLSTPSKVDIISGEHTVQVFKEMYAPATEKVTVTDGQISSLNISLKPTFAELNIIAPSQAVLYVNGVHKGVGSWQSRLVPGIYSLEARLDKHTSAKQDIELAIGDKKTVDLEPTPIYGSLDIITTPSEANITIDGKDYGVTPNTIGKLLIGDYTIRLCKSGYKTIEKKITISGDKAIEVSDVLISSSVPVWNQKKTLSDSSGIFVKQLEKNSAKSKSKVSFSLCYGYHQTNFIDKEFQKLIDSKNISTVFGQSLSFKLDLHPIEFGLNVFQSQFKVNGIYNLQNNTSLKHEGIEMDVNYKLFKLSNIYPYLGVGYQLARLYVKDKYTLFYGDATKDISLPLLKSAIRLKVLDKFLLFGEYKRTISFSSKKNASVQWSAGFGYVF